MFKFEDDKSYRMPAHFGGAVFDPEAKACYHDVVTLGAFGWRYVPKVGGPGADLSQPILFPMRLETESAWAGSGTSQMDSADMGAKPHAMAYHQGAGRFAHDRDGPLSR
jgi:hypothetical protein